MLRTKMPEIKEITDYPKLVKIYPGKLLGFGSAVEARYAFARGKVFRRNKTGKDFCTIHDFNKMDIIEIYYAHKKITRFDFMDLENYEKN